MDKLRVFALFLGIYYIETPYVQHQNGERSRDPINGQPQFKDTLWTKEQEQKGLLIIDHDMKGEDCYDMQMSAMKPKGNRAEYGQINATVTAAAETAATFKVGLGGATPVIIPNSDFTTGSPTISGTYGADSLTAIGDLALLNGVNIARIHHNASDESVYETNPSLVTVTSVGGLNTMPLLFPKSDSKDENTNIRDMNAAYFKSNNMEGGLRFNGMNYLNYSLPKAQDITLTFYTVFTPK